MATSTLLWDVFGGKGMGGGLVALQLLLTYKKWTSTFYFQSNEPSLKFISNQMGPGGLCRPRSFCYMIIELFLTKWVPQNFYRVHSGKKGVEGGPLPSDRFRLLKSELELSISNWLSPLSSLYEHCFYKNLICPHGITYNACPGGLCRPPEFWLYDLWTIFNQMATTKFYPMYLGKKGVGGLVALQSLLTLKKWTKTLNFQSNEPSLKFIRASLL